MLGWRQTGGKMAFPRTNYPSHSARLQAFRGGRVDCMELFQQSCAIVYLSLVMQFLADMGIGFLGRKAQILC
jgi:hypothetical protein